MVTELRDGIYYADLVLLRDGAESCRCSSRPSDAIALAARTGAPIFVTRSVLDEAGVEIRDEDEEDEVERFRSFLDEVDPEDFGSHAMSAANGACVGFACRPEPRHPRRDGRVCHLIEGASLERFPLHDGD